MKTTNYQLPDSEIRKIQEAVITLRDVTVYGFKNQDQETDRVIVHIEFFNSELSDHTNVCIVIKGHKTDRDIYNPVLVEDTIWFVNAVLNSDIWKEDKI